MFFYKYPLFVVFAFISACSFNPSHFTPTTPTDESLATVYIYRPSSLSNIMINPTILLNDKELFTLAASRYAYTHLQAGHHNFRLDLGKRFIGNKHLQMNIKAGNTYYLKISTSLRFEKNAPYTRRFDLLHIESAQALEEIRLTQLETSSNNQDQITTNDTESSDADQQAPQFDLSKSRNPFGN